MGVEKKRDILRIKKGEYFKMGRKNGLRGRGIRFI